MQVIFLPVGWMVALCFIVWPVLQVGAAFIALFLPDRIYTPDRFFFKAHRFEREGRIYDQIFKVSRWKHLLPDGGMVWKKHGYAKKHLTDFSPQNLSRFLIESARGELTHWLAILPFWVFGFFTPPGVVWLMLLYALAVNMPCILAQRYNRPRIQRVMERKMEIS